MQDLRPLNYKAVPAYRVFCHVGIDISGKRLDEGDSDDMTIELYLEYETYLSPLWCWLPIGWMGVNIQKGV